MTADTGVIFILSTLESSGRPCAECGRMFMTTPIRKHPDADLRHPSFLNAPAAATPVVQTASWPEPCGLTPDEIRQIILEVLG